MSGTLFHFILEEEEKEEEEGGWGGFLFGLVLWCVCFFGGVGGGSLTTHIS